MEFSDFESLTFAVLWTIVFYFIYKSIKTWGPFEWEKRLAPFHYQIRLYGILILFIVGIIGVIVEVFRLILSFF